MLLLHCMGVIGALVLEVEAQFGFVDDEEITRSCKFSSPANELQAPDYYRQMINSAVFFPLF